MLRTIVADTGIGMSKEFPPHLFDSFVRERNTTAVKAAGSGLGMEICGKCRRQVPRRKPINDPAEQGVSV